MFSAVLPTVKPVCPYIYHCPIEQGFIQNEIARSAYEYQKNIETGEKIIVGVNKFQTEDHQKIPILKVDDSIRTLQIEKLEKTQE